MNNAKVFIAIPTVDAWVHAKLMQNIIEQMQGHHLYFLMGTSPLGKARNEIVKRFLKTDCTHLWFVDADTIPPVNALSKMLEHDADIVSGVTPVLTNDGIVSNVFTSNDEKVRLTMEQIEKSESTINATGVGASCLLVARRVFESAKDPWFAEVWLQDGRVCECDIFFCNEATDDGYLIIVDPKVVCQHVKEVAL